MSAICLRTPPRPPEYKSAIMQYTAEASHFWSEGEGNFVALTTRKIGRLDLHCAPVTGNNCRRLMQRKTSITDACAGHPICCSSVLSQRCRNGEKRGSHDATQGQDGAKAKAALWERFLLLVARTLSCSPWGW